MRSSKAHIVFFSPTGTTRKILENVAVGAGITKPIKIDLTLSQARHSPLPLIDSDLLLLGVPVYEEHIPFLVHPMLKTITGQGQPAVVVAVYGNVGYGVALQQLESILTTKEFNVIAGAAFIGEHSFSRAEFPIASNRPDETDMKIARDFGCKIAGKLIKTPASSRTFPGHLPLFSRLLPEGSASNFARLPDLEAARCTQCGQCAKSCPINAIDFKTMSIDESKCLRCFACVRNCPRNARSFTLKHAWLVKRVLKKAATVRQEPSIFM
jgi:ferredoxin